MTMTHNQLKIKLETFKDPRNGKTFKELNAVKGLIINKDGVVDLRIELENPNDPNLRKLKLEITKLIKIDLGFKGLRLDFIDKARSFINKNKNDFKYLAILSGKGGVGKTTVTVELAKALQRKGLRIGVIDSDIFGASIPSLLGLKGKKIGGTQEMLQPVISEEGIAVVSTAFLIDEDQALIWRAPLIQNVLDYFFNKTLWDKNLDLILIDMPPGTGDVLIDVLEMSSKNLESILVTTPDLNAASVALKSGIAIQKVKLELVGVVENMSYLFQNGKKVELFGRGGGDYVANKLSVPMLQEIPLAEKNSSEFKEAFDELAETIRAIVGV